MQMEVRKIDQWWWFVAGYVIGAGLCLILCHPNKMFKDGYKAAKKHYGDWQKGFEYGWDAAFKAIRMVAEQIKLEIIDKTED